MAVKTSLSYVIFLCIVSECYEKRTGLNNFCEITGTTMLCKQGIIPKSVPAEIRDIFIKNTDMNNINQIQLNNVSLIQTLDIEADKGHLIPQRSFEKFLMLTYLGLHGKELSVIHVDAFIGLDNLVTLNMSSNRALQFDAIGVALNSENRIVLPNLKTLSVAKVKTSFATPVKLDNNFVRSISRGRTLKHIDLSELNILKIDFRVFEQVCTSLESVNLKKSFIGNAEYFWESKACKSLRTIDISEGVVPALRVQPTFESLNFYCQSLVFYSYVQNLYAYRINTENDIEIRGYFLDMLQCPLLLKKIDISGNRIKWLNMTVQLHETTRKSLSTLDLSNNDVEYISPAALRPSENLESLDFSHNRLNIMQEHYKAEFEVLFLAQAKLLYLNLSYNGLTGIPKNIFSGNRLLKVLDISFNKIKILNFYVVQMVNIEMLIARHNQIHTVHRKVRKELDFLRSKASANISEREIEKSQVYVYLTGNQFVCTCDKDSVELVNWLHSTEVIDRSEKVTCKLSGTEVDIKESAPEDTEYFCTMKIVKKTATISVPLVATISLFSIYIVVRIKRRRRMQKQVISVISQIKSGSFPLPHLVFLAYCSEDTDLVLNKIYPQLCDCLAKMTQSEEKLVCIGDKHFRPGFALRFEVMRCVEESSVFIAVISKSFCHKNWCNLEVGWAYDQNKPIIMLMLEHVEKISMDHFLGKIFDRYAHASWKSDNDGGHIEPDWKTLCTSIIQLAGKHFKERKRVERQDTV